MFIPKCQIMRYTFIKIILVSKKQLLQTALNMLGFQLFLCTFKKGHCQLLMNFFTWSSILGVVMSHDLSRAGTLWVFFHYTTGCLPVEGILVICSSSISIVIVAVLTVPPSIISNLGLGLELQYLHILCWQVFSAAHKFLLIQWGAHFIIIINHY